MTQLTLEKIWSLNEKDLLKLLESEVLKPKYKKIRFYTPSFSYYKTKYYCSSPNSFPTISVTGKSCFLKCKHCGGKILETMHPVFSPNELFDLCIKLKQDGAQGCLISGGCLPDGSVPLDAFVDVIGRVKKELDLTVFVHTGIINFDIALSLKQARVDVALIDVIGSAETIKKIYNLKATPNDYAASLKALEKAELPFVPHVIVGLNEGRLDGELEALKMINHVKPSAIVIIAFMPIFDTGMAKTNPPKPIEIAKVAIIARMLFPETPLILGCMRPKGAVRGKTDVLALKAGVDAIAFPSEDAIKYVQKKHLQFSFSSYCCAQMFADVIK